MPLENSFNFGFSYEPPKVIGHNLNYLFLAALNTQLKTKSEINSLFNNNLRSDSSSSNPRGEIERYTPGIGFFDISKDIHFWKL